MNGFEAYRKHVNPVLAQIEDMAGLSRRFVRAEGCCLWDDQGNKYLDFISGHGSFNLGHNHPAVAKSVAEEVMGELPQIYGLGPSPHMGELAAKLARLAREPFEIAFFSNSGTEAVEGALKIARAATRRSKIVYCHQAYHGMTLGSLSMIAAGPWRDPFEPLLPDFIAIPFNDLPALETVLKEHDCAGFVVEPVQAEGGVCVPAQDYLDQAGELCRKYGALLILDEVQTGLGRTGSLFAFQGTHAVPDVFTLAKSLGGGIMPVGAYLTTREIFDAAYGSYEMCAGHHSTFGGNTLSCRVALQAVDLLSSHELLAKVRGNGEYFIRTLGKKLERYPLVRDIRGKGLLIGIEFAQSDHPWLSWENLGLPEFTGQNAIPSLVMKHLLKNRITTQICGHNWNVLKIEPPLIVEQEEIDRFIEAMDEAVKWVESIS